MIKYDSDETNWSTFIRGVRELSCILRDQIAVDPACFARLTLQLISEVDSACTSALFMGFGDAEVSDNTGPLVFGVARHIASLGQVGSDRFLETALQKYYREVPFNLIELIPDRVLHVPDPTDKSPMSTGGQSTTSMCTSGINMTCGSLAEMLGSLSIADSGGRRTALVVPYPNTTASDPVLSIRSCIAYALAASLRHTHSEILAAFATLI